MLPQLHCVSLLLLPQGLHVGERLGEFFHEFSHDGAARFHAVDQTHALAHEIRDELARFLVAPLGGSLRYVESRLADKALQGHWQWAGAV